MRKLSIFTLAAGCAAIAVPAMAQDEMPGSEGAMPPPDAPMPAPETANEMAPDQKMQYDTWSQQEQATYDAWPADHQAYFWTLVPQRQTIYWRLSEADRATIAAMADPDRETAWMRVEAQMAEQPDPSAGGESPAPEEAPME